MMLSRRRFLQTVAMLNMAGALSPADLFAAPGNGATPLPLPPLLEGEWLDGKRHFRLTAQPGQRVFLPGLETPTLGFNGDYLGPILRMKRGDTVAIEVINALPEVTTVHWHGMILPARMDGGPHQPIPPGKRWLSEYKVIQPASTLFYHAHTHGLTGSQVYRGLAGLLYIDDESSHDLNLPREYGVDDIPVVIQDRDFSSDGRFRYLRFMPERMIGKHGKFLLVNGAISPLLKARVTRLRLRLVNASNARFYRLAFSDGRPFQLIASDGGLLPRAQTLRELVLAPAERCEIIVDLSDRGQVALLDLGGAGNAGHGPMRMMGMDTGFEVLAIDASQARRVDSAPLDHLVEMDSPGTDALAVDRKLILEMGMMGGMGRGMMGGMGRRGMMGGPGGMMDGMMRINGQSFDMQRVDFSLKANTEETWRIGNDSPMLHPFHVHNTQFRVLQRSGRPLAPAESGYKDTVTVYPGEEVLIRITTGPYRDARNPYMFHCHILEHEDRGMMGQFTVV